MRKTYFTIGLVCLLGTSMLNTSCIGSFQLTNKMLNWNRQIGNKFVNELVFFAFWFVPVYEVSALADLVVLNSIEFWSGENPVAQGRSVIEGNDGRYFVDSDSEGYTITSENDGSVVRLDFDKDEQTWSVNAGGEKHTILTFVDDSHVRVPGIDGDMRTVELSQQGLYAYRLDVEAARGMAFIGR